MSIWPFLLKYDLLYTPFTFLKNTYYATIPTLSVSFYSPKKPFCCNYFRPCSIGLPSIFCQRKKFKKAVNQYPIGYSPFLYWTFFKVDMVHLSSLGKNMGHRIEKNEHTYTSVFSRHYIKGMLTLLGH